MVDEFPGVVITIKDIYKELNELTTEVRNLATEFRTSKATDDDHEKRLRAVERWMYAIPATLIVAITSAVFAFWRG